MPKNSCFWESVKIKRISFLEVIVAKNPGLHTDEFTDL